HILGLDLWMAKSAMNTDSIVKQCLSAFEAFAERQPRWLVATLVGAAAWFLSFLLYAPRLWGWSSDTRVSDFLAMCANPLERHLHEPILAYRITTPAAAWIFHLPWWGAIGIQYVAAVLTLSVIYLAMQSWNGRATALLTCLAISLTYVSQFSDIHPGY